MLESIWKYIFMWLWLQDTVTVKSSEWCSASVFRDFLCYFSKYLISSSVFSGLWPNLLHWPLLAQSGLKALRVFKWNRHKKAALFVPYWWFSRLSHAVLLNHTNLGQVGTNCSMMNNTSSLFYSLTQNHRLTKTLSDPHFFSWKKWISLQPEKIWTDWVFWSFLWNDLSLTLFF